VREDGDHRRALLHIADDAAAASARACESSKKTLLSKAAQSMRTPCGRTMPLLSEVCALALPCASFVFSSPPVLAAASPMCTGFVFSSPPPVLAAASPRCAGFVFSSPPLPVAAIGRDAQP
jgi:hypothetical protein